MVSLFSSLLPDFYAHAFVIQDVTFFLSDDSRRELRVKNIILTALPSLQGALPTFPNLKSKVEQGLVQIAYICQLLKSRCKTQGRPI